MRTQEKKDFLYYFYIHVFVLFSGIRMYRQVPTQGYDCSWFIVVSTSKNCKTSK